MLLDKGNNPAYAQPGKLQRVTAGTGRQAVVDAPPPPATGEPMEFAMSEDGALLNKKMKEKNKMDYESVQNEVERVRMKLQRVRMKLQRKDTKSAQIDDMLADIGTCKEKEVTGTVATLFDSQAKKLSDLQRAYLSQRNKLETALIKLEAATEELASANEELAASNEELAAANEKVAASNEELAAANEKVAAANANIADIKKKLADANKNLKAWQIMDMILWGERPDDIQDIDDDPAY